jgi:type II secretory pathway predicted ATPase ExeA
MVTVRSDVDDAGRHHGPGAEDRTALQHAPTSPKETSDYIRHRLCLAGRSDTLFTDYATSLIHQTSRGYPRMVNNLAIQSPIVTYTSNKNLVDDTCARATVAEVTAK